MVSLVGPLPDSAETVIHCVVRFAGSTDTVHCGDPPENAISTALLAAPDASATDKFTACGEALKTAGVLADVRNEADSVADTDIPPSVAPVKVNVSVEAPLAAGRQIAPCNLPNGASRVVPKTLWMLSVKSALPCVNLVS